MGRHQSKYPSFADRCYRLLERVPAGKVTTYKEIARALGRNASRAVGNAMNRNPNAPRVPCHRVVRSDGKVGGYAFGQQRKIDLLRQEGVVVADGRIVDFSSLLFRFPP